MWGFVDGTPTPLDGGGSSGPVSSGWPGGGSSVSPVQSAVSSGSSSLPAVPLVSPTPLASSLEPSSVASSISVASDDWYASTTASLDALVLGVAVMLMACVVTMFASLRR